MIVSNPFGELGMDAEQAAWWRRRLARVRSELARTDTQGLYPRAST